MVEKIVKTTEISREEWLSYRRKAIGGSDAAIIVGLQQFGSPLRLWGNKHGIMEDSEDTEVMRQGRDLEEYVAARWCEATGKKVRRRNYIFQNPDYPFAHANIDREVVGENAGLECKTTSVYNKSDFSGGQIPPAYYVQCQHYMAVMGYDRMYLAVLVLSKGFYHFCILRDQKEIDTLMDRERAWWEEYIIRDSVPDPDGSDEDGDFIRSRYPEENGGEVFLDAYADTLNDLFRLDQEVKKTTKERDACKQKIMEVMGDAAVGTAQGWQVSYKSQTANRVDGKALKERYPNAYAKCLKPSVSRVFRYKKLKEDK